MYILISIVISLLIIAIQDKSFRLLGSLLVAICIFLFYGLRVNVGVDWLSYKEAYVQNDLGRFELLFRWYAESLRYFDLPVYFFFGLIGYMQFILLFKSARIRRQSLVVIIFVFTYFLLPPFLASANGIRQFSAAVIVLWAFSSLRGFKKYFSYLMSVLFHFSSPIFIVLLELGRRMTVTRRTLAIIFITSLVFRVSWVQIQALVNFLDFIPIRRLELVILNIDLLNTKGLSVGPRRVILFILGAMLIRFIPKGKNEHAMLLTMVILLSIDNLLLDLNSVFRRPLFWWYALLPVTLSNAYKHNDVFEKTTFTMIIILLSVSYFSLMVAAEWQNLNSTDLYIKI